MALRLGHPRIVERGPCSVVDEDAGRMPLLPGRARHFGPVHGVIGTPDIVCTVRRGTRPSALPWVPAADLLRHGWSCTTGDALRSKGLVLMPSENRYG